MDGPQSQSLTSRTWLSTLIQGGPRDPLKVDSMHLSVVNLTSGNPGSLNKRNRLSLTKRPHVSLYFVTLNPVAGDPVFHISKPGRLHPVQSHCAPARDD